MESKSKILRCRTKKKDTTLLISKEGSTQLVFSDFNNRPMKFTYPSAFIHFCVQMFLTANVSYRACSKICDILSKYIEIKVPHFTTIRTWVLRFGYYCLDKPKEIREDWIYILDYTIATSKNKCLMILGIPMECLKAKQNVSPCLYDMEPLCITVTPKADWQVAYNALLETSKLTGVPLEIISDHGADIKKGIEAFCLKYPRIHYIYDVTHLIACKIKAMLFGHADWEQFTKCVRSCKQQTKQSVVSFLSPPSQRSKARFLNIALIINWSKKILKYRDKGDFLAISESIAEKIENKHNVDNALKYINEGTAFFNEKFSWIDKFKKQLKQYSQYVDVIKTIKTEITTSGVSSKTIDKLKIKLKNQHLSGGALKLKKTIMDSMEENFPKNINDDEIFLGCSDVIESLFGKYKNHCSENSMRGITQSVLIMAAATTKPDETQIKTAMEYCTFQNVQVWSRATIGKSDFSKRKTAFIDT